MTDPLPRHIVEHFVPKVAGATFFGIPIEDLQSRTELLAVIGCLMRDLQFEREIHARVSTLAGDTAHRLKCLS